MNSNIIDLYTEYILKTGDRFGAINIVTKKYSIEKAIYPGSYVHITPSLIIPEVLYVDTDKKAKKFFSSIDVIKQYIKINKKHSKETTIAYQGMDFNKHIECEDNYFDLMISLYAGFISQACKRYLKREGMLLANDSHGDATLAYVDEDYEFVGIVVYRNGKYIVDCTKNDRYFKMKKNKPIDMDRVYEKMAGPKYAYQTEYYLFRKIK